jgi:hypothetical protein
MLVTEVYRVAPVPSTRPTSGQYLAIKALADASALCLRIDETLLLPIVWLERFRKMATPHATAEDDDISLALAAGGSQIKHGRLKLEVDLGPIVCSLCAQLAHTRRLTSKNHVYSRESSSSGSSAAHFSTVVPGLRHFESRPYQYQAVLVQVPMLDRRTDRK